MNGQRRLPATLGKPSPIEIMTTQHRIVRNIIANWLGLAVNMAVAVFMAPFLVHQLGDTAYGLWVLLLSVTGYMGLLDAGLKVAVVKHVARFHAQEDVSSVSRVASTALWIYGGVSIAIVAAGLFMAPFVSRMFSMPPEAAQIAPVVLMITSSTVATTLLLSVFNGVLAGVQRYDRTNFIAIGVLLVRSVVIVVAVKRGGGIVALGVIHLLSQIVGGVLTARLAFREVPGLRIAWSLAGGATARSLYGYSFFILLNNVAMFLLFNSAEIVIGVTLGVAAVTYYAIAGSLLQYLSKLIGTMTQVLHPYASAQDAKGDAESVRRAVVQGTKACLLIGLPVSLTFVLVGEYFIRFWMGAEYATVAGPLLVFLAGGRLFWLSQSSTGNILLGIGRHRLLTTINLVTGVAGLALGAGLVSRMGLLGMAVGMCVPMVITQGLVLPPLTARMFGIPLLQYWREAYWPPVLASVPYGLVLSALLMLVQPHSLLALVVLVCAAAPVLLLSAYYSCFTAIDRDLFWSRSMSWRPMRLAGSRR